MHFNQKGKWVFIVNPIAGNGLGKSLIPSLHGLIQQYTIDAELVVTESKGHASKLAIHFFEKGYKNFVGVGGDGTVNEMVRPLLNKPNIVIGAIPAGTGNDFIQILGFPDRFEKMDWNIFFGQHVISMDAGICNGIPFVNGMGLGFDAQVAAENYNEPGEVKKGGKNKYLWQIIKTLLFFKEQRVILESDGKRIETNCFINTIANGRRFAGGFFLTPQAVANDGLLDVCNIEKLNLIERFKILPMVPKGIHLKHRKVNYYQTDKISIEFETEVPFHLDGEIFFGSRFDVQVVPRAFHFIYNPEGNHFFS
jgi:diacylglycerol kinase (ATP)